MKSVILISCLNMILLASCTVFINAKPPYKGELDKKVFKLTEQIIKKHPDMKIVRVIVHPEADISSDTVNSLSNDIKHSFEGALSYYSIGLRSGDLKKDIELELIRGVRNHEASPDFIKKALDQADKTSSIWVITYKPSNCNLAISVSVLRVDEITYSLERGEISLKVLPDQSQPFQEDLLRCKSLNKWRHRFSLAAMGGVIGGVLVSALQFKRYDDKKNTLETTHDPFKYRKIEGELETDKKRFRVISTITSGFAVATLLLFIEPDLKRWSYSSRNLIFGENTDFYFIEDCIDNGMALQRENRSGSHSIRNAGINKQSPSRFDLSISRNEIRFFMKYHY